MTETLPNVSLPVPEVPPDELPREYGSGGGGAPYPGTYTFQLPPNFCRGENATSDFEVRVGTDGVSIPKTVDKQKNPAWEQGIPSSRRMIKFNNDHPLTITAAVELHKAEIGKTVMTSISSLERNMARKGATPIFVAATTYLLRALGATNIYPSTLDQLIELLAPFAGAFVKAELEWRGNCGAERPSRVLVVSESGLESVEDRKDENGNPVKGCGAVVYMRDWPKDQAGQYHPRIQCSCGALLYPMAEIRNFKPVPKA